MTFAWFNCGNGRQVYRRVPEPVKTRSDLPSPMFISDTQDEMQSMADGKFYTSKAAMRATYKADGNPHGVEFTELGHEDNTGFIPPKRDRKADREAIERAICQVDAGNVPPVLTTDNFTL